MNPKPEDATQEGRIDFSVSPSEQTTDVVSQTVIEQQYQEIVAEGHLTE